MFAYSASFAVKWSPQAKPLVLSFAWLVYFAVKLVRVARVPRFKTSKADPCRSALLFPFNRSLLRLTCSLFHFLPCDPDRRDALSYFGFGSAAWSSSMIRTPAVTFIRSNTRPGFVKELSLFGQQLSLRRRFQIGLGLYAVTRRLQNQPVVTGEGGGL